MAASFPVRLAFLAAGLLLLWRILEVNLVHYDPSGRPRLGSAGTGASLERSSEIQALRDALDDNPAESAALLMLARDSEARGDTDGASRAYRAALEIAPYDRDGLLLAAAHFLRHDEPLGVEVLARLATQYPETRDRVFAALASLLVSGTQREAVSRLLSRKPAWFGAFVLDACARGVDPAVLAPWLAAGGGARPETDCAVDRLRSAGRWEAAYQLWLNSLPREQLRHVGFVFNGGFEREPAGAGFDWVLQQRPEREAGHAASVLQTLGAADKRALRVIYNGNRQVGSPVEQYLALAPGQYTLSGMVRHDGIKALRGVHWTVRCVRDGKPQGVIAASERFLGSSEWRRFTAELRVAESCDGQLLRLEPVAEEGTVAFVSGTAWFDELRIERR